MLTRISPLRDNSFFLCFIFADCFYSLYALQEPHWNRCSSWNERKHLFSKIKCSRFVLMKYQVPIKELDINVRVLVRVRVRKTILHSITSLSWDNLLLPWSTPYMKNYEWWHNRKIRVMCVSVCLWQTGLWNIHTPSIPLISKGV